MMTGNLMMSGLMAALKDTKVVRVTGSRAMGTEREDSDIDFYVTPDRPDTPIGKRNIDKVIAVIRAFGLKFDSTETGYIFTHRTWNQPEWLDAPLDISDRFELKKGRKMEVDLYGVGFRTH